MANGLGDPPEFHSASACKTHEFLHSLMLISAENQGFSQWLSMANGLGDTPRFHSATACKTHEVLHSLMLISAEN